MSTASLPRGWMACLASPASRSTSHARMSSRAACTSAMTRAQRCGSARPRSLIPRPWGRSPTVSLGSWPRGGSAPWPGCRGPSLVTEPPPRNPEAAGKLQILATEHWSLLATRSLIYQESFGRVNMFLAILSGAVIALALIAQADRFGPIFMSIAIFMLTVVFFVGIATVRRLLMLNHDDYLTVIGMNRLRHGYFDLHPELEPNFTTSPFDDLPGALRTMGIELATSRGLGNVFHGFVTLPGMVGVIVSSVGAAIGGGG